jgi:hypothetical protein
VSNRTPYKVLIADRFAGTANGATFSMCEHAARTCRAVAMVVWGANWTVIHCWLSAASIFPQPVSATANAAAAVAGTAIRARRGHGRCRTPTLYGLGAADWLTGPTAPYRDVNGDDAGGR